MKNQYFGDINDYRKYGLLRILATQFTIGVGWMLTPDDGRTDGKFINYLNVPNEWRHYDPPLFDVLKKHIGSNNRHVEIAESENIIPNARYWSPLLMDAIAQRQSYMTDMMTQFALCDLIFLDPDNGLEVKSVGKGKKDSCKYVYWDEIETIFTAKKSIVFYQHFRRVQRDEFIMDISTSLMNRLKAQEISIFRTAHVAFFFVPQIEVNIASLRDQVSRQWKTQIEVDVYPK